MPVISMELLPGGTLKDRVPRRGRSAGRRGRRRPRHHRRARRRTGGRHPASRHQAVELFHGPDGSVKVGDFGLSISTLARDVRHELADTGVSGHAAVRAARAAARRAARRARRHLRRRRDALLPADRTAAVRRSRPARAFARVTTEPPHRHDLRRGSRRAWRRSSCSAWPRRRRTGPRRMPRWRRCCDRSHTRRRAAGAARCALGGRAR